MLSQFTPQHGTAKSYSEHNGYDQTLDQTLLPIATTRTGQQQLTCTHNLVIREYKHTLLGLPMLVKLSEDELVVVVKQL